MQVIKLGVAIFAFTIVFALNMMSVYAMGLSAAFVGAYWAAKTGQLPGLRFVLHLSSLRYAILP